MKVNTELRDQIFEIITTQIRLNDPPETKITYDRLVRLGYTAFEAKQLIGQCIAVELFGIMKEHTPFDEAGYIKNLEKLPSEPFD